MYEFDQFKEKLPRSPYAWVIPFMISGLVLFIVGVVALDYDWLLIVNLPFEVVMMSSMIILIATQVIGIIVITHHSRKVASLISTYVYPTIVDRINIELHHQYTSIPHSYKTPLLYPLREVFGYSTATVAWQLSTADLPRIDIQKIVLMQSNGKSQSTVFDGFLIVRPIRTLGYLMLQPYSKIVALFKHKDTITLADNTTMIARGEESLCTPLVQQFYHTLLQHPTVKKAYLSMHEGNLKVLVQLKKQKFTRLKKFNDTEYEAITNDLRSMLNSLDQLIQLMMEFPHS